MFWLETIIASVICSIAVSFRIKAWMKEHGYSKDDFKKSTIEDKMCVLALLCVPVINLMFMILVLIGAFSDTVMEEAVKELRK